MPAGDVPDFQDSVQIQNAQIDANIINATISSVQVPGTTVFTAPTNRAAGTYTDTETISSSAVACSVAAIGSHVQSIEVTGHTSGQIYLNVTLSSGNPFTPFIFPVQTALDTQLDVVTVISSSNNSGYTLIEHQTIPPLALRESGALTVQENHLNDSPSYYYLNSNLAPGISPNYVHTSAAIPVGKAIIIDSALLHIGPTSTAGLAQLHIAVMNSTHTTTYWEALFLFSGTTVGLDLQLPSPVRIPYNPSVDWRVVAWWLNGDSGFIFGIISLFYRYVDS